MNKEELKRLIKALAQLDSIDDQQWILSNHKEKITEENYRTAQAILAMYNAKIIFKVNYTQEQFKLAYDMIK